MSGGADIRANTARGCGQLRATAREPGVQKRREVVEQLRRRAVRAQDDMPVRRDVGGRYPVIRLQAHHVRIRSETRTVSE